jgi:hypothetical protein
MIQSSAWSFLELPSVMRRNILRNSAELFGRMSEETYSLEKIKDIETAYSVHDWIASVVNMMERRESRDKKD